MDVAQMTIVPITQHVRTENVSILVPCMIHVHVLPHAESRDMKLSVHAQMDILVHQMLIVDHVSILQTMVLNHRYETII